MPPNPTAVELRDVRFAYPAGGRGGFSIDVPALAIPAGQRVACVGPSGSGKSTLVNLIAGILTPDRGRITVGDVPISTLSDRERRAARLARIGMVFQELELLEYLSALDNILLPLRLSSGTARGTPSRTLSRETREAAAALADATGIGHTLRRRPARLSQGERQRVALCRALIVQPTLILADEPTGNLDPAATDVTLDLMFEQVSAHGATLFMVTHNHGLLGRFDRTVDVRDFAAAEPRV